MLLIVESSDLHDDGWLDLGGVPSDKEHDARIRTKITVHCRARNAFGGANGLHEGPDGCTMAEGRVRLE